MKEISQAQQKQINHIIEHFNFERCQKTMIALSWVWHDDLTPDIDALKEKSLYLLDEAAKSDSRYSLRAGGGLYATKDDGILSLSFHVEDWECCDEDLIKECVEEEALAKKEASIELHKEFDKLKKEWIPNSYLLGVDLN